MEVFAKVIETIGVMAFAISGSMIAIRRKTDLFGVVFLSIITALGGGLSRDVIFGFSPPVMFSMYDYFAISFVFAIIVFIVARKFTDTYLQHEDKVDHIIDVFDALGIGIFAVMGTKTAIEHGYTANPLLVISSGLITCIGGGVLRDVLTKHIPFILFKRVYAIAALGGTITYYIMFLLHINDNFAIIAGFTVTFVLRILAMVFKWNFPKAIK